MSWNIAGCSGQCTKCQTVFINEQTYNCYLFLDIDGPKREDYCQQCWQKMAAVAGRPDGHHSYWQGRYKYQPEPVKEEPLKGDVSKRLLKKWLDSPERLHQCFCYILALMLLRKKYFQQKPSLKNDQGKEELVYEDRETGETYILADPGLSLAELDQVESQLQEMLKKELAE